MCSHETAVLQVRGSAKGATGWFRATEATVSFDHPAHAVDDHTLNIDVRRPADGPASRVAIELDAASARALAAAILVALDRRQE